MPPRERTGEHPGDGTGDAPGYCTGDAPGYRTPDAPGYCTGDAPGYRTPEAPGYRTGERPGYRTGDAPGYRTRGDPGGGDRISAIILEMRGLGPIFGVLESCHRMYAGRPRDTTIGSGIAKLQAPMTRQEDEVRSQNRGEEMGGLGTRAELLRDWLGTRSDFWAWDTIPIPRRNRVMSRAGGVRNLN